MLMQGITPNFQELAEKNKQLCAQVKAHASTHFILQIPSFLADDAAPHAHILVLEADGNYQPHHIVRLPLGVENYGYLLIPVNKSNKHIKATFRTTDKFEQCGDIIDSFGTVEASAISCLKDTIQAYYPDNQDGITLSLYTPSYDKSSGQFFIRALAKEYTKTAHLDAIKSMRINVLDSFKEQNAQPHITTTSHKLMANKPMMVNFTFFGEIQKNVLQQDAYDHIFQKAPVTIENIQAKNAELLQHIRRYKLLGHLDDFEFEVARQLCARSYALAGLFFDLPQELLLLKEDGTYHPHRVMQLPGVLGLYGYLFIPTDKNDPNIRIVFRGTNPEESYSRYLNYELDGPCSETFPTIKDEMLQFIKAAIRSHYGDKLPDLTLTVTGHSQGGSSSQLFITELLRERANSSDFDAIKHVTMTTFNDPGVSHQTRMTADELLDKQHEIGKPITIKANYGIVTGDFIQQAANDMIFVRQPYDKAKVTLLQIDKELVYKFSTAKDIFLKHHNIGNFFSSRKRDEPVNSIHFDNNNKVYSNQYPQQHEEMLSQLLYKRKKTVTSFLNALHLTKCVYNAAKFCTDNLGYSAEEYAYLAFGAKGYIGVDFAKSAFASYCRGELHVEPRALLNQFKSMVEGWAVSKAFGLSSEQVVEEDAEPCLPKPL